jgi:tetratricopeptide (TPR) repeat protein
LRNAIRELEASTELVRNQVDDSNGDKDVLLTYLLPLEVALCKFQLATELRNDGDLLAEVVEAYEEAQKRFPQQAIIRYRYGRALAALGDYSSAIKKLEEANGLLSSGTDTTVDKNHWLRLSVPRNLGVFIWQQAEALKNRGSISDEAKNKILEMYLGAYEVTRGAYSTRVDPDALSDKFDTETHYRGRLANNLLYYVADYIESGGDKSKLYALGFKDSDEDEQLALLEQHFDAIETPATLHTMLRYYIRNGSEANRHKVARKLTHVLRELGVVDAGGTSQEEDMLRVAQANLPPSDLS